MAGIRSKVAAVWVEFLEESSFHGIKYFISKPTKLYYFTRFIWVTIILVMTGLLFYGLYDLHNLYRKFDFQTKSHIKYQKDFKFPKVYICSTMAFDSNKVDLYDKRSQYIHNRYVAPHFSEYSADEWNDTFITEDFLNNIKFSLEDTIVGASYNLIPVGIANFTTFYQSPLKPCILFEPPERPERNLLLIMNLNKHRFAFPVIGAGIEILLASDDILAPGVTINQFGAGLLHQVVLSPKIYNHLPSPYNSYQGLDCVQEQPDQANSGLNSTRYSYTACIRQCFTKYVIQKCGCITEFEIVENKSNFRFCSVYERENCAYKIFLQLQLTANTHYSITEKDDEFNCNCKHLCTETVYEQDTSSMSFQSQQFEDLLVLQSQAKDRQQAKENLIAIMILFTNSKVEYIYHEPQVTETQWLSTLGGFIGLYLGASILTFIELIFALIKTIVVVVTEIARICSETKVENLEPETPSKTE